MSEKTTFKIDGVTYQQRRNQCGNDCKTCRENGGHIAYYKYMCQCQRERRSSAERGNILEQSRLCRLDKPRPTASAKGAPPPHHATAKNTAPLGAG
jgi:hypothetical protein